MSNWLYSLPNSCSITRSWNMTPSGRGFARWDSNFAFGSPAEISILPLRKVSECSFLWSFPLLNWSSSLHRPFGLSSFMFFLCFFRAVFYREHTNCWVGKQPTGCGAPSRFFGSYDDASDYVNHCFSAFCRGGTRRHQAYSRASESAGEKKQVCFCLSLLSVFHSESFANNCCPTESIVGAAQMFK